MIVTADYNSAMRTITTVALALVLSGASPADTGNDTLTAVPGIKVGHHTLSERPTAVSYTHLTLPTIYSV